MIVRELVALLRIDFDRKGVNEAEGAVSKLRTGLASLGVGLGFGALFGGVHRLVSIASDGQEQMNVLRETFKENTDQVVQWADVTGKAMGRSHLMLEKYAGSLGALLAPMLGNRKTAADMSTELSGLAVDLGSFFNLADDDVLVALRAGIVGETEPMRRLGVELTEASLQAFALENGISKTVKSMTIAEKVQLRYRKILADTRDKQGDAVRTADGFANSSKRLSETLKDVGATIGGKLIGPFTSLVHWGTVLAGSFKDLVSNTEIVESALITLGAIATGFAIQFALANLPIFLFAAAFGVVLLAIEDLVNFLKGNDSVIGTFFKELNDGIDLLIERNPALKGAVGYLKGIADSAGEALGYKKGAGQNTEAGEKTLAARTIRAANARKGGTDLPPPAAINLGLVGAPSLAEQAGLHVRGLPKQAEEVAGIDVPNAKLPGVRAIGGGGTTVNQGDINITVQGNADQSTVRGFRTEAERILQNQSRDLKRTSAR